MFTNPDIIERLKSEFIPFAGNTNELQVSKWESPEKTWFLSTAEKVHPGATKGVTAQGFYIVGADGQAYTFSMHGRQHDEFMRILDDGLAKFKASPSRKVKVDILPTKEWTTQAPKGTLAVRTITRVTPLPEGCSDKNTSIGRDHYWIFPSDVADIRKAKGDSFAMPTDMARRIARFHLVDNVRGEPTRWRYNDMRVLEIQMQKVDATTYRFEGLYKLTNNEGRAKSEKGIAGRLRGEIQIDASANRATSFEAFAEGYAWGDHDNTDGAPEGKFPLKIGFRSVDDEIARTVPPQQSYFWEEYIRPTSPIRVPWP